MLMHVVEEPVRVSDIITKRVAYGGVGWGAPRAGPFDSLPWAVGRRHHLDLFVKECFSGLSDRSAVDTEVSAVS